jgi:hypothetical protein
MTLVSFSPAWFYGYDVALEVGFAVSALIIALFAYRIYRTTDQRQVLLFGSAFLLISFSYFMQSLLNLLIVTGADTSPCCGLTAANISMLGAYGTLAYILLMISGLTVLAYMTLRVERLRVLWLMLILAIIAIIFSISPLYSFFMLSTILLAVVLWHYVRNYQQSRQTKTLLVVLAFGFLLFGSLHFMLSVDHALYYAIGHILEMIAYMLILANLYLVLYGKKA